MGAVFACGSSAPPRLARSPICVVAALRARSSEPAESGEQDLRERAGTRSGQPAAVDQPAAPDGGEEGERDRSDDVGELVGVLTVLLRARGDIDRRGRGLL